MEEKIRIGVAGAGHLGKIHLKLIKELSDQFELVGFVDVDAAIRKEVAADLKIPAFNSLSELLTEVDALDIVTPTLSHYDIASQALKQFKHVFLEKPIANTLEEARSIGKLAEEAGVIAQVGHVERFNPAFTAAKEHFQNPMFIETHRLAQFNPRGTDVPVVLDLMIHDLDIILSVVNSNIRRLSASGVAVVSDTPDIANARIEFDNGCVANLTTSRISLKNMRKTRFFQKDAYISVDFLDKTTEIVRMKDVPEGEEDPFAMMIDLGEKGKRQIIFDKPEITPNNAIKDELSNFGDCIRFGQRPIVPAEDGTRALDVALRIMEKLRTSATPMNMEGTPQ